MLFITAKKTPLIGKEIVNTNFITLYSYSMKMRFFWLQKIIIIIIIMGELLAKTSVFMS